MNSKKTIHTTVREKVKKTAREENGEPPSSIPQQMSSTMEIPVEAIFEDISTENISYLDISCPGKNPARIPLSKNEIIIGREDRCRICLPFTHVSRKHARLIRRGEEHIIEDLESTNGTYVNGVRISRCILRNNDQIRIGEARILFVKEKMRGK